MLRISKYSLGVGDRFAHQAKPQLRACMEAAARGVEISPVWNKSNREHGIVGSEPASVKTAASAAVRDLGWNRPWHVDADHINQDTVGRFLEASDFYTLDVAAFIGKPAERAAVDAFVARHPELTGEPFPADRDSVRAVAGKYLFAVQEAGRIYRRIESAKGA